MQPNITVMIALKNKKELPISSIKFDDNMLAWAANENSKFWSQIHKAIDAARGGEEVRIFIIGSILSGFGLYEYIYGMSSSMMGWDVPLR